MINLMMKKDPKKKTKWGWTREKNCLKEFLKRRYSSEREREGENEENGTS